MESKQVALITGANGGIGSATAELFANNHYNLILNYHNQVDYVTKIIEKYGEENVLLFKADVRFPAEVSKIVDEGMRRFGRIDVIVNAAGIVRDKTFRKLDREKWDEVLDVNLNGIFNVTKAVIEILVRQGEGSIINVSSIIGKTGNFGQTNYAASKAAIFGFTKSLAQEMAPNGITVNAIAPGFVETHMVEGIPEEVKKKIIERIPLKRFAQPHEIADLILFLTRNRYITGSIIDINGGLGTL